jgi:hypothetical protein
MKQHLGIVTLALGLTLGLATAASAQPDSNAAAPSDNYRGQSQNLPRGGDPYSPGILQQERDPGLIKDQGTSSGSSTGLGQ